MMAVCSGIKRDGSRCTATVEVPREYCWWHDPANAGKRRQAASKGGKGGGGKEIRDLKRRISDVIDAVLEGSQDRGRAAVAIQGFNALKGVLELERAEKAGDLKTALAAISQARRNLELLGKLAETEGLAALQGRLQIGGQFYTPPTQAAISIDNVLHEHRQNLGHLNVGVIG